MKFLKSMPFILIISVFILSACEKEISADLSYPNKLYSYEKADEFICNRWCTYDDEYLNRLNKEYSLDKKVVECKTEFEKVQVITELVTNLWNYDGDRVSEKDNPISILYAVTDRNIQYRCVEYEKVIAGCLNALGIPTCTIALKTNNVDDYTDFVFRFYPSTIKFK